MFRMSLPSVARLVCLLCLLPAVLVSATPADSIRRLLPTLPPQQQLRAYSNLCQLAAADDNPDYELQCIATYIAEAHRLKAAEEEGEARSMQINTYYNYDFADSITAALPASLAFMAKHRLWDYHYNCWNVQIESLLYQKKLQTALDEASRMYADARTRQANYGLGVASYCMGHIYQLMQRYPEAHQSLTEGIAALSKEEDVSLLLIAYNVLGETLDAMHRYDELRTVAGKWCKVIDDYKKKAEANGYTPSLDGRYLYCTLAQAVAELGSRHYDECLPLLNRADELCKGRKSIARFKLLQVKARYFMQVGRYADAIACNNQNLELLRQVDDRVSLLTVQQQQADALLMAGKPMDAALLYKQLIPAKDSLRSTELTAQLDELRTLYQVDRLQLEQEITTSKLNIALVGSALLLVLVLATAAYTYLLRRKNKALRTFINQLEMSRRDFDHAQERIPDASMNRHELLYRDICRLVRTEQLFLHDATREEIAMWLGSNATYVADAIKNCGGGATVTDFLNECRVRYMVQLFSERPALSIKEAGMMSGFNSASTYERAFKKYYSMSPGEYRRLTKDTKLKTQ